MYPGMFTNSFSAALPRFSRDQIEILRQVLSSWDLTGVVGSRIRESVEIYEHFLPADPMSELLTVILESEGSSFEDSLSKYRKACWERGLRGGPILNDPPPRIVGNVVDRSTFEARLFELARSEFLLPERVTEFVTRLCAGRRPLTSESSLLLANVHRAMWATWNESNTTADPFSFRGTRRDPDEIRANLGLWHNGRFPPLRRPGVPLLLFRYQANGSLTLFRPTIADAAGYPAFRPPEKGFGAHGKTDPWPAPYCDSSWTLQRRPEAVHRPVAVGSLVLPLLQLP
jgi:hypothetical protein